MTQPSPVGGQGGSGSAAGGGVSSSSDENIQKVTQLAQTILSKNQVVPPGERRILYLPEDFKRLDTKGSKVTRARETPQHDKIGAEALSQLIAEKFGIEGLLDYLNYKTGILVYYKKDQLTAVKQQGQAPKIVKKEEAIPTTLNLSEMLLEKPFEEVKEIYELGDAIFQTWAPGEKAFILGCKTQYQPTGTKSFQGYEDYDVLQGWSTCPPEYGAQQQVEKVLKDFKIEDVAPDQKAEVIQKYQLERDLGSNPKEYNPGKILALLGENPLELIQGILRNEEIEKSEGKIPFLRDKGKVQKKIELRNRFIAECCGYSQNEDCQAAYHEYFRTRRPFPFRDNMGIIEHFGPLREFSTDEEIRKKLERFERKEDFLEKFNKISSNAYRTTLQTLVRSGESQDRLRKLRSLDTALGALPEQNGEHQLKENYKNLRAYDFESEKLDLVAKCGVDKLTDELRGKQGAGSNYRFGEVYLQFVEIYLTQQLLKNKKIFTDLTPQEIELYLTALIGKTKLDQPSPSDQTIPSNRAHWNGIGLKLKINNEQLANQIWIAIHAHGFVPTNPSALSGWYQEFRSNPPEGETLQGFLDKKERDFQDKLAFVQRILPPELAPASGGGSDAAPEGGSAAAAGGGSAGPVSESSGRKKEEQYIALELQKNWDPLFSNQDACLGINQSLGARKKEIEKILLNKKLLNPTDLKDRNRNKKIEAITKDISQIAIDSFKVNSKRLDQLVEDWINSEPDPQAP
jgi:hypothetical protein